MATLTNTLKYFSSMKIAQNQLFQKQVLKSSALYSISPLTMTKNGIGMLMVHGFQKVVSNMTI